MQFQLFTGSFPWLHLLLLLSLYIPIINWQTDLAWNLFTTTNAYSIYAKFSYWFGSYNKYHPFVSICVFQVTTVQPGPVWQPRSSVPSVSTVQYAAQHHWTALPAHTVTPRAWKSACPAQKVRVWEQIYTNVCIYTYVGFLVSVMFK